MNPATILGVDLSDYIGWGVLKKTGDKLPLVECGLIDVSLGRFDTYGTRFMRSRKALSELLDTYKPNLVVYETWAKHKGVQAAQVLNGHLAILTELCEARGITGAGFDAQAIKKHATGNRLASKALMIQSAKLLWPEADIPTDDVADALHAARLGASRLL